MDKLVGCQKHCEQRRIAVCLAIIWARNSEPNCMATADLLANIKAQRPLRSFAIFRVKNVPRSVTEDFVIDICIFQPCRRPGIMVFAVQDQQNPNQRRQHEHITERARWHGQTSQYATRFQVGSSQTKCLC